MEIKEIQELIKFVSKSGVNEVSIERKDFKITIKTTSQQAVQTVVQATVPVAAPVAAIPAQAAAPVATAPAPATTPAASAEAPSDANLITIKSPMIGTFYRQASPEKPSFVNVGDEIRPGQVLCIIEAMKLFNEIESEISGRIVKVLVENASPVEYDQPLFLVEPM
ncbi:acetyl-CoA carboxylase biotin carboxyl carrier protein [Solitalea canadensis]|uniref:Biotin carboxyl carrier protein of acetyl-CoA carboxylase n=1 Tax=Solitalea canadensis (strain ATCC 29591 / DSM 3403 / JCM 21819 / LMG 8368 / NBRC 15130 / NCIMB 12057 / USAM 9D) TaxID=929556 RepID=H8KWT1_SOLCM|nr:acetyl-CoA carboxylase biotin carboxyl carrier protein [Solitalea canadensis]AFD08260.1 acetyl-CoA carboxylase, biotin carboxyl carrier protein [Solitalea canadensis DSM 3403]